MSYVGRRLGVRRGCRLPRGSQVRQTASTVRFYNWTFLDHFESEMGVEYRPYNEKGVNIGLPLSGSPSGHQRGEPAEWYKAAPVAG